MNFKYLLKAKFKATFFPEKIIFFLINFIQKIFSGIIK